MASIDYHRASALLEQSFTRAEEVYFAGGEITLNEDLAPPLRAVFESNTQAYREVLLGCCIARILNSEIDIHLPYVSHGENAFNGRELDERVVNPFLQLKQIPSTKGPYLSTFRRQAKFYPETRDGLRDKAGFDELLVLIEFLAANSEKKVLDDFLAHLLFKFIELREGSNVSIARVQRISLPQYRDLLSRLINIQSGGWFPVILVVSMFQTIKDYFDLNWDVTWQSINVADAPSGVGGDVSIISNGNTLLSVEITLRQVDKARLVSTFNTKIATSGIEDYLFLVGAVEPSAEAIEQAERYFAQGHEINFAEIVSWLIMMLATLGRHGREMFGDHVVKMLDSQETSQAVKVAWNEAVNSLFVD